MKFTVYSPVPVSVILDTFPLAIIATVPVPLKFTHARQVYEGAEPEGVASTEEPSVTLPLNVAVVPVTGPADSKSGVVMPFVPSITTVICFSDQRTTQREPLETVTVTPESMLIGPVLMALRVPGIV